jgi:hypothetical protein
MDASARDIWRLGALDERRAAAYLSISDRAFRTLRRQMKFARKRIRNTKKVVYSRLQLREFLASCGDA